MPPRINIPPVSRILLIVLGLQSVLSAAIRYRQWTANSEIVIPYLTLIPQLSLVYPWTFVTTTLVEGNVFTLAIACLTLYHGGRYLERAWSSREFAKFLLVVAVIPNTLVFAALILLFTLTRDERWTLTTISGTIPLQASFLVAFSQLVPAHTVTLFRGILSLRVPRFPLVYVGLVALLSLTPLLSSAAFLLATTAFLTSWTYLRFYKPAFPDLLDPNTAGGGRGGQLVMRGDASETFAFAEFFPGVVRPVVRAVGDRVFEVLVAVGVCTPFSAADVSAAQRGGGEFGGQGQGQRAPGSARAEAERRRALALKALDQRLHAATANAASRAAATAPSATGPTVQSQPVAGGQKNMSVGGGGGGGGGSGLLGETSYNPEGEGEGMS